MPWWENLGTYAQSFFPQTHISAVMTNSVVRKGTQLQKYGCSAMVIKPTFITVTWETGIYKRASQSAVPKAANRKYQNYPTEESVLLLDLVTFTEASMKHLLESCVQYKK